MSATNLDSSPSAIWQRIVQPVTGEFTPEEARAILKWKFSPADVKYVDQLSAKARAGTLTPEEERQLDDYLEIESLLGTLKSRARVSLKQAGIAA